MSGRHAPRECWADVSYLDPSHGDHKVTWELNRHQHWLSLGRAWWLSGESRYRDAFTGELESWMRANPPLLGINWASALELSFRCLSWIWALELFADEERSSTEPPWTVDLLVGLERQLRHVDAHLSRYFSPNTHLLGEALALYVGGAVLPELRRSPSRVRVGRAILIEEATRQVLPDGGHAERSPHYHRYALEFYLLALSVAHQVRDDALLSALTPAAVRMASFMRHLCDDAGRYPLIGDDDGGELAPDRGAARRRAGDARMGGRAPRSCGTARGSAARGGDVAHAATAGGSRRRHEAGPPRCRPAHGALPASRATWRRGAGVRTWSSTSGPTGT